LGKNTIFFENFTLEKIISVIYRVSQKKWGFVLGVVLGGLGASNRKISESGPPFGFNFVYWEAFLAKFGRVER